MSRPFTPLLDRMLAKVDKSGPCWLWTGATCRGYGQVGAGGKRGRVLFVHRAMWECLVGPIPEGMQLDHLCRVPACCNPDHLEPVTPKENTRRGTAGLLTGAKQRAKTHCAQGHPYSGANLRLTNKGWRECRACDHLRYLRKKEKAA